MEYYVEEWALAERNKVETNCGSQFGYFAVIRERGKNYDKSGDDDYVEHYIIQNQIHYRECCCFSDVYYRFGILAKKNKDGKYTKCDEGFYITKPKQCENVPDFDNKIEEAIGRLNNSSEYVSKEWGMSYYDRDWCAEICESISYKPFKASYAHSSYIGKDNVVCCDTGVIILNKQFVIQTITHSELLEENINGIKGEEKWNNYCLISIKNTNTGEIQSESYFVQSSFYISERCSI